ncbi:MAG: HAMP domain-containing sensor histidine kinase [Candidatus Dormibacteria bacterium]
MSLRGRVLVALLVVVFAGLLVADVATYQSLHSFLVNRVDAQIDNLRDPVLRSAFGHDRLRGPRDRPVCAVNNTSNYTEIRDPGNAPLLTCNVGPLGQAASSAPAVPDHLPASPTCGTQVCDTTVAFTVPSRQAGGPDYRAHVWSVPSNAGTLRVVVALPLGDVRDTLNQLLLIEVLVTLGVLGGATGAGLVLVRLGLRPLNEIELTAGAIAAGDLTQRVRRAEKRTEVGRLGLALNSMLGQIESAFAEKEASEQRLRRFLADASHELRTPLTSIRGYAELFRRGADSRPDDLARVMLRIEEEGARMGVLVDDLLLLARLDQGRPLERGVVNLTEVAAQAVDAARAVEPGRPIEFEGGSDLTVRGDQRRLRQVFDNLLANVRTHTPGDTRTVVRLRAEGAGVIAEVADFGPGLPAEDRERVFDRFFRADPGRSRDRGGAGLGLAISRAIIESHGGSIEALDSVPCGTTMRIHLPSGEHLPILSG